MESIIRKQVTERGVGNTPCYITIGKGIFELQGAEVVPDVATSYAQRAVIALYHELPTGVPHYTFLANGWSMFIYPLRIPYRRIIEGPCRIYGEVKFDVTGDVTLYVSYRRIHK